MAKRARNEKIEREDMARLREALSCLLTPEETDSTMAALSRHLGRFSTIMGTSEEALASIEGVSPRAAKYLRLTLDVAKSCIRTIPAQRNDQMIYEDYRDLLWSELFGKKAESVAVVLADSQFRRLYSGIVMDGTLNEASMNVTRLAMLCIQYRASAVVLAHNHPTGLALPSAEDIVGTTQLLDSLAGMDVSIKDHIIFTDTAEFSFAKNGLMREMRTASSRTRMERLDWARDMAKVCLTETKPNGCESSFKL